MKESINTIIHGDSREKLKKLKDKSIRCCVTSPPYYGLRDYGVDGQIGLEKSLDEYVQQLVEVFREVKRILTDDGTLWLNLGDSYATGTTAERKQSLNPGVGANRPEAQNSVPRIGTPQGYKTKDLIGVPWMVAFALRADGWYLRSDIIWNKPNAMPESVTDRPTKSHEYIFLLSKSEKYYYDHEAIKEPIAESTIGRGPVQFGGKKGREYTPAEGDPNFRNGTEQWGRTYEYKDGGRNKRSVWNIPTKSFSEAHFATFPEKLIEPCILAGSKLNDIILDPFFGAGTTALVALQNNRNFIGIELNPEYIEIAERRLSIIQPVISF